LEEINQKLEIEKLRSKVKTQKRTIAKLIGIIQEKEDHISILEECLESEREKDATNYNDEMVHGEEPEEKIDDLFEDFVMKKRTDTVLCKKMTRLSCNEFEELVTSLDYDLKNTTTFRGQRRKQTVVPPSKYIFPSMVFLTLFWLLAHYPVLALMSCIFSLHERTITAI